MWQYKIEDGMQYIHLHFVRRKTVLLAMKLSCKQNFNQMA